jgi:hypothetical protein
MFHITRELKRNVLLNENKNKNIKSSRGGKTTS